MRLLRLILKVSGKRGVPQGGVISPLLSNIYLNEVDKMLEKAKSVTSKSGFTHVEYARFADDLVVLVDGYRRWNWLVEKVYQRLLEEFARVDVTVNEEKTRLVDLMKGESFSFLGFDLRSVRTLSGKSGVLITPRMKARTNLLRNLKEIFQRFISQPVGRVIELINPKVRGWVNYFRMGHSSRCFQYIKDWGEKKIRRHLMRARKREGFGWDRWSRDWFYGHLGLYADYKVRYYRGLESAASG
jgi:RNA-directed DNA polymerase